MKLDLSFQSNRRHFHKLFQMKIERKYLLGIILWGHLDLYAEHYLPIGSL